MKRTVFTAISTIAVVLAVLGGAAISAQDKYTLQVPGGLAFADFRGYESWPVIAISENGGQIAVILGNSVMMDAIYLLGVTSKAGFSTSTPSGATCLPA